VSRYSAEQLDELRSTLSDEDWEEFVQDQMDREYFGDDEDSIDFADPGGTSALRAATRSNPRNLPCPTCGGEDRLTPQDVALGYQCDPCADRAERGFDY
jgi:hypothetical protein